MTIEQAKQRIEELKPFADQQWQSIQILQKQLDNAQALWHPVYTEIKNLENFIKLSEAKV